MTIRTVLADDHPIFLDGLRQLLALESDIEVVAACVNGEETLAAVREHRPDVLVLDIRMPGKSGLDIMRELKRLEIGTKIVLLTANASTDEVIEAVRLGAQGLVLKEMTSRLLLQCIRTVHEGHQWLEKESVAKALQQVVQRDSVQHDVTAVLTPREREVLRLTTRGLKTKQIAAQLNIAEGTVRIHLHSIYEKLHVDGRVELALYAREHGIV
jgi:DNA-binding NarL/FixJ family response regulator